MDKNIKATIKEIKALITAWHIVYQDYSDCKDKDAALKIIDELLIGKCEDLADWYEDND